MKFRTEIKCSPASQQIDHDSKVVLLGSCFSEHMEAKFDHFKFKHFSNPFGILFNPLAIQKAIQNCVSKTYYSQSNLVQNNDTWLSLNHHSKFNNRDPEKVLHAINENIFDQHYFKEQRDLIIKAYIAVRTIRLMFANHPLVKSSGIEIPKWLYEGLIWDF